MVDEAFGHTGSELQAAKSRQMDRLKIISVVIGIKGVLLVYGGQVFQALADQKLATFAEWLNIWHRWDAVHYRKLAEVGYSATGEMRPLMVFYPLFPWLIRFLTYLTDNYVLSIFLISTVASVVAAVLFYNLVSLDYPRKTAMHAVWFLFIFPTSYFLHIGYTESLFLALAIGCIYAARTGNWMLVGIIGALACMTRANGLVLVPALAVEIAHQYWLTRRLDLRWLWVALVPLGFGVYLAINASAAGDAFAFMPIRQEAFYISSAPPWVGVQAAIGQMGRSPSQAEMLGMQEFIFIALGFVCMVVGWFKLRPIYSVWITFTWLLVVSVTFIASVPRYTLTMFPIFILFAILAKRPYWLAVITFWSLLYLGFFSSLFVWGRWAF